MGDWLKIDKIKGRLATEERKITGELNKDNQESTVEAKKLRDRKDQRETS